MPICILVADDHPLVRRGTCEILAAGQPALLQPEVARAGAVLKALHLGVLNLEDCRP